MVNNMYLIKQDYTVCFAVIYYLAARWFNETRNVWTNS